MNWTAIDFETANASRNSACAIGVAVVEAGRIVQAASWLIRPPTLDFDPFNVSIHGITADDVKDSPTFDELWCEIGPSLAGKPVVAHNASFDISVLRHSLDEYRVPYPQLDYYCTCNFCRAVWPGQIAYRLDVMADLLGIRFQHHDAEEDAAVCARIALECCRQTGVTDLATLAGQHMITAGKLYPGGYSPCSRRRSVGAKRDHSREPFPNGDGNEGPLFAITGTLQSMTRREAAQKVVDHGWRFKDNVTRSTDFLVVGEEDFKRFRDGKKGNKLRAAEDLLQTGYPIEIIAEDDFLRMLDV
ncbi:MAG TPA: DNA polymerase III [Phycisphaerales bacterium]|nr:DNA polymerase III [Phycisphaerales bacterium]